MTQRAKTPGPLGPEDSGPESSCKIAEPEGVKETSLASEPAAAQQLMEEQRLVEEAQSGNLDAMRPIFERYASPLYATVILPRLGDQATAEDVLRDTMMTAVVKIRTFQWQGKSIYAWLRQIAVNKVYDVHRQSKRSQKLVEAMAVEMPTATAVESQADAQMMVEEERRINKVRIEETIARLPERYQRAIRLRLIEEHSREECARLMDVTIGNFDVLFFRAVRSFRKQFGDRENQ
jgi:RNA polymerase sigma factor (sigma-70 family)